MWFKRELYDNQSNVQRYTPEDQDRHQITVQEGKLYYQGKPFSTLNGSADGRAMIQIIALTMDGRLITAPHAPPGVLHHSTLVNGGPGYFFGEIRAVDGKIQMVSNMSGHYTPSVKDLYRFASYLRALGLEVPDSVIVEIDEEIEEE